MEKYEVLYNEHVIANAYVDEKNILTYEICSEFFDENILEFLKISKKCNIKDFPFLYIRIENIKKFGLDELEYETDNYRIRRIK